MRRVRTWVQKRFTFGVGLLKVAFLKAEMSDNIFQTGVTENRQP